MKKLVMLVILLMMFLMFLLMPCFASSIPCDISISITSDKGIFDNGERIEFYNKLNNKSFDYIIEYWVEDSYGSIIKQKRNTTNQAKKSFTPKNLSSDIVIKSRIAHLSCEDINLEDNFAQKRILFNKPNENATYKTISVSFTINRDMQKLRTFAQQLKSNASIDSDKKEYKTKTENNKTKKLIPYFLITLTTLISAVLIWRR